MSRGSPALTAARKEEIITACAELNETMSFKEITIKEIGAATSLKHHMFLMRWSALWHRTGIF